MKDLRFAVKTLFDTARVVAGGAFIVYAVLINLDLVDVPSTRDVATAAFFGWAGFMLQAHLSK